MTQPGTKAPATAAGGFFNRRELGMLACAGFLGAGLLGMLFGGFSGLGGLSSIIGLMLQLVLIYFVVRFVMSWWQRRNASSYAQHRRPRSGSAAGSGPDGQCALGLRLRSRRVERRAA
jgi:predicted lipid-binding transport protein (Tim44 family)